MAPHSGQGGGGFFSDNNIDFKKILTTPSAKTPSYPDTDAYKV